MENLTGFQRDLLYIILDEDSSSGQDILESINNHYTQEIHHGRLYPNLDELVQMGLIVKGKQDERTNNYQITQKGIDKLVNRHAWSSNILEHKNLIPEVKSIT